MRLQKQLSRKVEGKKYPKYVITIPPSQVQELGWKEGMELETEVKQNRIILKPKSRGSTESAT